MISRKTSNPGRQPPGFLFETAFIPNLTQHGAAPLSTRDRRQDIALEQVGRLLVHAAGVVVLPCYDDRRLELFDNDDGAAAVARHVPGIERAARGGLRALP